MHNAWCVVPDFWRVSFFFILDLENEDVHKTLPMSFFFSKDGRT